MSYSDKDDIHLLSDRDDDCLCKAQSSRKHTGARIKSGKTAKKVDPKQFPQCYKVAEKHCFRIRSNLFETNEFL